MATSPAGWRTRAQGAQLAALRLASMAGVAIRAWAARSGAWLVASARDLGGTLEAGRQRLGPALTAGRERAGVWAQVVRTDLGVIAGGGLASAARRATPLAHATWRGLRVAAVTAAEATRRAGRELPALVAGIGAALPQRQHTSTLGARVLAEGGDDLATILGRIDAAGSPDVVLVVPRGVAALRTPAAGTRPGWHVRRRGLELMVVATRAEVRAYAEQTGFAAARTWGGLPGARRGLLPGLGVTVWRPAIAMIAGLGALVMGIGYAVPTAHVEIAPPSEPIEQEVQLRINPLAAGVDVRGLTVPATTVQRTVRASVSVPTTGTARVGDRPAGVRLEFANEGTSAIEVATGTVVRDEARRGFSTVSAVRVEPGATAEVDAIALRPGSGGNVPPQTLRSIEDRPASLAVTNPAPARGGSDRPTAGVSQADVDRARQQAEGVLARVAARQIAAEHEGGLVVGESMTIAIIASEPLMQLEEAAESFVAEYVARVSVVVVPPEATRTFAERYLADRAPNGRELVRGASTVRVIGEPSSDGGRIVADVVLTGATVAKLDRDAMAEAIAGASAPDAQAALRERLRLASDPGVTISPAWLPWPWLPSRSSRITFAVTPAPKATATPSAPVAGSAGAP